MKPCSPRDERIKNQLTEATISADLSFSGLSFTHRGPLPVGALLVPTLVQASASASDPADSDLARERVAGERLRVLYHHSKLFKKDLGRWPAEVAELDGYVDFKGNPGLLKLRLSSRKQWSQWLTDLFEVEDEEETDDADEEEDEAIDDDLFVIEWGTERWTLGLKPGTLEHLEKLFIDQDGRLHRVEAPARASPAAKVAVTAGDVAQDETARE